MKKWKINSVLVIISTLLVLVINILANALPINGQTTGEISDRFNVFFVPSGYVFSIWGLIYIGLIIYCIYQALPANRDNPTLNAISAWYVAASVANSAWIIFWHYDRLGFTLIAMIVLLVALSKIYLTLDIGRQKVTPGMRYCVHLVMSIYLAWITVATIANVTDVLYTVGWKAWGIEPKIWAVIMMAVAVIIAEMVAFNRRDLAFMAVIIWALVGIGINFQGTSPVAEAAYISAAVVALMVILTLLVRPRKSFEDISGGKF